jgi:hypothetical protein
MGASKANKAIARSVSIFLFNLLDHVEMFGLAQQQSRVTALHKCGIWVDMQTNLLDHGAGAHVGAEAAIQQLKISLEESPDNNSESNLCCFAVKGVTCSAPDLVCLAVSTMLCAQLDHLRNMMQQSVLQYLAAKLVSGRLSVATANFMLA